MGVFAENQIAGGRDFHSENDLKLKIRNLKNNLTLREFVK